MSPRPVAGARLRRILALIPWIADHPGVTVDELAARFGVARRDLERDLEILPYCGLPPYSPDRLIDVEVDEDGGVRIRFAEYFARPLRPTPEEGFALLAAGRALLEVPGSDPEGTLASALHKLEAALGPAGVTVEIDEPPHLEVLRRAAADHHQVEIDYLSYGRGERTTRTIDPYAVFHAFGHWYAEAYCHRADDERLFRVDRVQAARATDATFDPPKDAGAPGAVFNPSPNDPRVTLWLAPEAGWVVETYPTESVDVVDHGFRVVLAVSERAWLERLLLRLGPVGRVLEPPEFGDLAATAANRLLARYR
ncbi:MAG: helix-turn-helix transcriptional regulator [Acidimicrobiia bacterium]